MAKILVVEDEELIRTMIQVNLEKESFAVQCCESAEEMLNFLDTQSFDLILLDVRLPGMNGEEALEKIKERGIATPVIMATALDNIQTKLRSFEQGADDYISKPFDIQELQARIKAVLRRANKNINIPKK